jgi:hypothetical protein
MIPVEVDWPRLLDTLHRRGLRDKDIFDKMADQGVVPHHDMLRALRTGDTASPRYEVGAALMNLYRGSQGAD